LKGLARAVTAACRGIKARLMPGRPDRAIRPAFRFNAKGRQAHGRLWAEKVAAYLDRLQL
jgi:hypothetical protein